MAFGFPQSSINRGVQPLKIKIADVMDAPLTIIHMGSFKIMGESWFFTHPIFF